MPCERDEKMNRRGGIMEVKRVDNDAGECGADV